MKGKVRIAIETTNECGEFPITEGYVISRDNTYESIDDWVDVFKKILHLQGFHPEPIKEAFAEEE